MIRVCDAIMGTGKSQSAIAYMNSHPDKKYVYITPYLDEAARIKAGCPDLHFVEPSKGIREYGYSKAAHTTELILKGKNVTTTHQAFKYYTRETIDAIRDSGYILFIDESVDVLDKFEYHPDDLQVAVDAGLINFDGEEYSRSDKPYSGEMYSEIIRLLRSRNLIRVSNDVSDGLFYWSLPPELITAFEDVFILTYLFEGQSIHHFLEIYNLPYTYIGIEKTEGGTGFRFCDYPGYTPEYVKDLKDVIQIVDNKKLNLVGDDNFALSMNWFAKNKEGAKTLKNNVDNYFNNINRGIPVGRRLWGTFQGDAKNKLKGKGYTKAFLTFNVKATNAFKDRDCLVYLANIFMNVNEKKFYLAHGINVDEDVYALSIMIQWIWRSAIREGNKIVVYIPSSRMRRILTEWIDITSKGGNYLEKKSV